MGANSLSLSLFSSLPPPFFPHPVRGRVSVGSTLAGGGDAHAEQGRAMMAPLPGAGEAAAAVMVTRPSAGAGAAGVGVGGSGGNAARGPRTSPPDAAALLTPPTAAHVAAAARVAAPTATVASRAARSAGEQALLGRATIPWFFRCVRQRKRTGAPNLSASLTLSFSLAVRAAPRPSRGTAGDKEGLD